MTDTKKPVEHHGAELDFSDKMSYGDYLQLEKILTAQTPLSTAHDEMLFIIQHQTSELWMRLAIYELKAARQMLRDERLRECFKVLSRIARIFEQINKAWDVLRTMTPSEYTEFRDKLGLSSGFQSWQYRAIEFLAGNKNAAMLKPHAHLPEKQLELKSLLEAPSLYDEVLILMSKRGFELPSDVLKRDWSRKYQHNEHVQKAWRQVYEKPLEHWELYELAEKLVDFEDYFRRWRFNHVTTVERVIGFKQGTGGTSGVGYLQKMLSTVLFPELWQVRTDL
ncbi:tryptophan 2,3-dioxygenase [Parvularcula sp. IMCC14364]|uniref:tryptophan 2,3-dioxygenase n=1 Tax=Parvularcula sp. IMCC14364 TaxID=3067902 RepID=UPI002742001B|nr:tryptophan 2,3-dioxygenase [Parvularcula sp. IMCC14364]